MHIASHISVYVLGVAMGIFLWMGITTGSPNIMAWAERLWRDGPKPRKRAVAHVLDPDVITHATCFDDGSAAIFLTEGDVVTLDNVDPKELQRGLSCGAVFSIKAN